VLSAVSDPLLLAEIDLGQDFARATFGDGTSLSFRAGFPPILSGSACREIGVNLILEPKID
jgi:hypothetical protein